MQRARAPDGSVGKKDGFLIVFPFMMRELDLQNGAARVRAHLRLLPL